MKDYYEISEDTEPIEINKWLELKLFFNERLRQPLDHPEFIIYFILIVFGFGALGVWSSIYFESNATVFSHKQIIENIAAFSIAIIASGSIELTFTNRKCLEKIFILIALTILIISVFLFAYLVNGSDNYFVAILFGIFSLLIWWIANAENTNLTQNFFSSQSEKSRELGRSLNDIHDK